MTWQGAIDTAKGGAVRFVKPFVVYRLPAWPEDVFGVTAKENGLPGEAQVVLVVDPFYAETRVPVTGAQGSLF